MKKLLALCAFVVGITLLGGTAAATLGDSTLGGSGNSDRISQAISTGGTVDLRETGYIVTAAELDQLREAGASVRFIGESYAIDILGETITAPTKDIDLYYTIRSTKARTEFAEYAAPEGAVGAVPRTRTSLGFSARLLLEQSLFDEGTSYSCYHSLSEAAYEVSGQYYSTNMTETDVVIYAHEAPVYADDEVAIGDPYPDYYDTTEESWDDGWDEDYEDGDDYEITLTSTLPEENPATNAALPIGLLLTALGGLIMARR